ncbi:MAG TPA: inner membrane-spanning protein YciB [Pseudomonadales bacterium]|nr:inner membrane-spanning protein YciB [Pseudomonadales bacterium]
MKFLFDFFPVLAFFLTWVFKRDMMLATYVIIAASALQLLLGWLVVKKVEKMHLISFGVLFLMGGLTIALNDERFIKMKPTLLNTLLGLVLLGTHIIGKRNLLRLLFDAAVKNAAHLQSDLPETTWNKLVYVWSGWFFVVAATNYFVASHFDTDIWMKFRFIGITAMNVVFFAVQLVFLSRHIKENSSDTPNS